MKLEKLQKEYSALEEESNIIYEEVQNLEDKEEELSSVIENEKGTIHHIHNTIESLDLGGEDELSNIQIACASCNKLKRNILPDDFANRVTNIFMYQMDKKRKGNFMWEISSAILRKII